MPGTDALPAPSTMRVWPLTSGSSFSMKVLEAGMLLPRWISTASVFVSCSSAALRIELLRICGMAYCVDASVALVISVNGRFAQAISLSFSHTRMPAWMRTCRSSATKRPTSVSEKVVV